MADEVDVEALLEAPYRKQEVSERRAGIEKPGINILCFNSKCVLVVAR